MSIIIIVAALAVGDELISWRFHRGDGAFADPVFDDSQWRTVDVPHDWSSEDLPPRSKDRSTPVLAVRDGLWRFAPLVGNASFAAPSFDDSEWSVVSAPADWHTYGVSHWNATGWFRRKIKVTAAQLAAARVGALRLALGSVASADVTYVNGQHVGATGHFFKQRSCASALTYRSYGGAALGAALSGLQPGAVLTVAIQVWSINGPLDAHATKEFHYVEGALPAGGDVEPPRMMRIVEALQRCNATSGCYGITYKAPRRRPSWEVKVYFKTERVANGAAGWHSYVTSAGQPGGLVDAEAPGDLRAGPFDAGASAGQRQTGYTVGGVGWYRRTFATLPASAVPSVPSMSPPQLPSPVYPLAAAALELTFEACYMLCSIWLNGGLVSEHPYGYTQFTISLPPSLLRPVGQHNTLAVRVDNNGSNSRWYSGSGADHTRLPCPYTPGHSRPSRCTHARMRARTRHEYECRQVVHTHAPAHVRVQTSLHGAPLSQRCTSLYTSRGVVAWQDSSALYGFKRRQPYALCRLVVYTSPPPKCDCSTV